MYLIIIKDINFQKSKINVNLFFKFMIEHVLNVRNIYLTLAA